MKIALVRLSSLGDVVHALGALKSFGSEGDTIFWIVDEDFAQILEGSGVVSVAIPLRRAKRERSLKLLYECYKILRALPSFDEVVDMQGLLKSALIARILKGRRWGFDKHSAKEGISALFYDKTVHIGYAEPIAKRNLTLLNAVFGKSVDSINPPFLMPLCKGKYSYAKGSVMFAIGSSKEEKRYPKERFVELANMIDGDIYIIATKKETEDAEFIANRSKAKIAPHLELHELTALLSEAFLVVSNDSGVGYMAWGLGVKTVLLFGPTNVDRFCPNSANVTCLYAKNMGDIDPKEIAKLC